MKENLNFNNLGDMYENLPNKKRPGDILIKGESIFEIPKSPAQTEMLNTAGRMVKKYLQKMGLNQKSFDEKRIAFIPQQMIMHSGQYHDSDFVAVDESSEANLGTIVHELIHAQSSEWRNHDEEELGKYLDKLPGGVKSGFQRNWYHKLGSVNLHNLNEGITDKISRDIMAEHSNELERLKPLFEGRKEEVIAKRQREFEEEILPRKIIELKKDIKEAKEQIEKYKKEDNKQIDELNEEIEKEKDQEVKQRIVEFRDYQLKRNEERIQYLSEILLKNPESRITTAKEINDLKIQGIEDDYSFSNERMSSYDFNVNVVNNLIEGIAKYDIKNDHNLNLDEEKSKVWNDLQEAYLKGRTVYLRKVEKVFGPGFIRKIESINPFSKDEEKNNFLKEMGDKIQIIQNV